MKKTIPIARPFMGEAECAAVKKVILSGWVTQGPIVRSFEEMFASYVGARYACAVSSCTTALHLALRAVGVKPGNIVITVSHSFIATANAVRHCMAEPVFIDIDPDICNMSAKALEELLGNGCKKRNGKVYYKNVKKISCGESPLTFIDKYNIEFGRISAILAVHQMGMPCDLMSIISIAGRYGLPVVEDAACAVGSAILMTRGRGWEKIGRPHGNIACFSFHPRKVITTGDGGMLTTNNPEYDRVFRLLRQHGMDISDVKRHLAKRISAETYLTTGYNYRMTDIQAAVGIEQLRRLREMVARRRRLALKYKEELSAVSWLKLPTEPEYAKANWQSYPVRLLKGAPRSRDGLMQYLLDNGISTRKGIMNSHQEKPYRNHSEALKKSEIARNSVILLPLFHQLKEVDIKNIARIIKDA